MNDDLNRATCSLLQVVIDMLHHTPEDIERIKQNSSGGYQPCEWRCEVQCVEAAWRAATEAQTMLSEARDVKMVWPDGAPAPTPLPRAT